MNSTPSPAERAAAIAKQARERREENRKRMPATAEFLDDFRKHLGDPVWFRFTENGLTIEWGERASWAK